MPAADGWTDEEALEQGRIALENAIQFATEDGQPLPEPHVCA